MKKTLLFNVDADIPEDILNEIIILYNLGVGIDDLKYLLDIRMDNF
jgi:hypothetical protein